MRFRNLILKDQNTYNKTPPQGSYNSVSIMFISDKNGAPQCKYKDLVVALFQYLVHLKVW